MTSGQTATIIAFDEMRRKRAEATNGPGPGSGYGHRRHGPMDDMVSLGLTTLILFWVSVGAVLMGLAIGLYVG